MGLLNLDKIKNWFAGEDGGTPTLSICMMGPRSVGKTTVLTSLFSEAKEGLCEGSKIYMNALDGNTAKLHDYHTMLMDAVSKRNASNLPASNVSSKFLFGLGLVGKSPSVNLAVQDFPGEYLTSTKQADRDEVYGFMANATVILIAIDTPFLMEEGGKYNEAKNKTQLVTHYLKDNVETIENKLVLFVPLKCERYFHDGRIEEVSKATQTVYTELINFFKTRNIASIVTPIMTLGGIEFDKMTDAVGIGDTEKIANYRIWEKKPVYSPLFCPQPLYYLLTYAANYYEWQQKQKKGFFEKLMNSIVSMIKKDSEFYEQMRKLAHFIIYDKNGFVPITTNNILKIN